MTHELSLMAGLMRKVEAVATEEGAAQGDPHLGLAQRLSHISPAHLREYVVRAAEHALAQPPVRIRFLPEPTRLSLC